MVQLLLESKAKINALDKKERQAMHWACFMGYADVVMALIEYGADIMCRDKQVFQVLGCRHPSYSGLIAYSSFHSVSAMTVVNYIQLLCIKKYCT